MDSGLFSLGTDESNDKSGIKKFRYRGWKKGTAEALFNNIESILREKKVDWENCVAVGLDKMAVSVGKKNSIMTRILAKNKNIFINGCPCHITHNTANKTTVRFSEVSGFDIEDFLLDLFHWFNKSSKRKVTSIFERQIIDLTPPCFSAFFSLWINYSTCVYLKIEYDRFRAF